MRLEDLGISAFIAGTAIGYLLWYWVRGGGKRHDLAERRALSRVAIIVGFVTVFLLAIGLWSASSWTLSTWTVFMIVLLLLVLLVIWRFWTPRATGHEVFALEFQATLAVVFGFVLVFLLIVLSSGPASLFLAYSHEWVVTAPIGALVIGMLFGSAGGEWVHYILLPEGEKTPDLSVAHRRWGYVLAVLLILGILYPVVPSLFRSLGGANVTTPIGGLSLTFQSAQSVSGVSQRNAGAHAQTTSDALPPWPSFAFLKDISDRDAGFLELFLQPTEDLNELKTLHGSSEKLVSDVLAPLGRCLKSHYDVFSTPLMILADVQSTLGLYREAVHQSDPQPYAARLRERLAVAVGRMAADLYGNDAKPCSDARDSISNWSPALSTVSPYASLGLAYLLYDGGAIDQSAREIAHWIDIHFGPAVADQIAKCNRESDATCASIAYKSKGTWHQLPRWYRIRAEFELAAILGSNFRAKRATYLRSKATIAEMEALFRASSIGSAADWMKSCTKGPVTPNTKLDLQRRAVLANVTMVQQMLDHLSQLVDEGQLDDEVTLSREALNAAETNTKVVFDCFPDQASPDDIRSWQAQFHAIRGILLTQAIMRREPPYGLSEIERAGRNEAIRIARDELYQSIPVLRERIADQRKDNFAKPLEERLFFLSDEEGVLYRARVKLEELETLIQK